MTDDHVILIGCLIGLVLAIALFVWRATLDEPVSPHRAALIDLVLIASLAEQTGDTLVRVAPQVAWEPFVLLMQGTTITGIVALWWTRKGH